MLKLRLPRKVNMVLSKVNPRREWHGDTPINAIDLFVEYHILSDAAKLGSIFARPEAIQAALWGEDGDMLDPTLSEIKIASQFDDQLVKILPPRYKEIVLSPARVKFLSCIPEENNRVSLRLKIDGHPTVKQIGELADSCENIVKISMVDLQKQIDDEPDAQADIDDVGD